MVLPLHIFEPRYKAMVRDCLEGHRQFGVVLAHVTDMGDRLTQEQAVGTLAQITSVERLDRGRMNIETVGLERFRIVRLVRTEPYALGEVRVMPLGTDATQLSADSLTKTGRLFVEYLRKVGEVVGTDIQIDNVPGDALAFAYLVAMALQIPLEEKQQLLSADTLSSLVAREKQILQREAILLERMRTAQETNAGYVRGQTDYISLN
jgi:Lon protease-like protein